MESEREVISKIKDYIVSLLEKKYGYCGVADCGTTIYLNSGKSINISLEYGNE